MVNKKETIEIRIKNKRRRILKEHKEAQDKFLFWLDKFNQWPLYLLIFLLPLFFLPWTVDVLDFNKQLLLLFLILIALLAWLIRGILRGTLEIRQSFLYIPLAFFLLVVGLASFFSLYPYGSFWGWPLKTSQSFFSLLGLSLFFFLFINTFKGKEEVLNCLLIYLGSVSLVALFGIFQIFSKFLFPWSFTQASSFNTIGTPNSWAIFLAIFLPFLISLFYLSKSYLKWFSVILFLVALLGLLLVNFWGAWLVVLASMGGVLIFGIYNLNKIKTKGIIILPAILLSLALLFGVFRFSLPFKGLPPISLEISPSFSHTLEIAKKTLSARSFTQLILGSGPGTFGYNFSLYKSPALNQTIFWNLRLNSGASEIFERLATFGVLGIIVFLSLIVSFLFVGIRGFLRPKKEEVEKLGQLFNLGVFSSFLAVCVSFFLYPQNLSLEFLFWFFGAGILILNQKESKFFEIGQGRISSILLSLVFIITLISALVILVFGIKRGLAQAVYLQGVEAWQKGERQVAITKVLRAAQMNPSLDIYWRDLSQLAVRKMNEEVAGQDLIQGQLFQRVRTLVTLAINSAKKATDVAPHNVANWQQRGFVYRNSMGLVQNSFDWALKSYERAKELEPTNPLLYLEIARTYIARANIIGSAQKIEEVGENLQKAEENLNKAIALKQDYWPAHFQIAVIYDIKGELEEAIAKLEEIKPFNLRDVGLAFQLGSYYWRKEDLKKAKAEFERAVQMSPTFANARYFLGLIYDKEGEREKAIREFEKIASFSEENREQVAEILENLRAGKPALGKEAEVPPEPEEIPALKEREEE